MIKVICGIKGSGKTKIMLDTANELVKNDKGVVVFIDPTESHMYDLDKKIRYVNLKEFKINSAAKLAAFMLGSISQNYDIDVIFIDALFRVNTQNEGENALFFEEIENISTKYNVDFYISASVDRNICPPYMQKYI
jgi:hypothetical protein